MGRKQKKQREQWDISIKYDAELINRALIKSAPKNNAS